MVIHEWQTIGSNPSQAQANLGSDRFSHREKRVRFYFPSVSPPTLTGKTAVVLFLEICAETNVSELTSIVVTSPWVQDPASRETIEFFTIYRIYSMIPRSRLVAFERGNVHSCI